MTRKQSTQTDTDTDVTMTDLGNVLTADPEVQLDEPATSGLSDQDGETEATVEGPKFELVSPYKGAQLIKEWFDVELPPQMLYTYVSKGTLESDENRKVRTDVLREWATALIARRNQRAEARKAKVEAELKADTKVEAEVTEAE